MMLDMCLHTDWGHSWLWCAV